MPLFIVLRENIIKKEQKFFDTILVFRFSKQFQQQTGICNQIIIIHLKMETRKMMRNQILNSSFENSTLNFNELNIDLNQLFDRVKALLSKQNQNKSQGSHQENNVRNIIMYLLKKMNKKTIDSPKEFIGMLVVFMYIIRFRPAYFYTFKFYATFYHNINNCLKNVYNQWQLSKGQSKEFITLVTLLFTISNMCQIAENNPKKKNLLKKILNPLFMEIFLQLQLPDNQIILRPYQTLLLKIFKRKQFLCNKKLLLISAAKHFLNSSSNDNAKKICLYVLNASYKFEKDQNALEEKITKRMIQQLRTEITKSEKKTFFNMSLLLAAKLLKRKDQEFIENFLTAESLFSLILHQKYCELNPLDIHGVIGFIKIFNQKKLIYFLSKMIEIMGQSSMARQIIHEIVSFLMPNIIIQLLEHNLLHKLGQNIQSKEESAIFLALCTFKKIIEKLNNFDYHLKKIVKQKIGEYLKMMSQKRINRSFELKLTIIFEMIEETTVFEEEKYIF